MEMNHEKKIQKQLGRLLWEDVGERDDIVWAREWRTLLAGECFSLSGIDSSHFLTLWPVRKLGEREEYLWQELASLERLKRTSPTCAGQIITEMTGAYLLVRGLETFFDELFRRKLYKVEKGREILLREDESPETAAYLNYQEVRLIEAIRQLGLAFAQEDYLWQFYRFNHPNLDNSFYFWREFGKLWKQLAGRELRPDLSDDFVCRHLTEVMRPVQRTEDHVRQVAYAFQEVGVFRNVEQKSDYIRKSINLLDKEEFGGIGGIEMLVQRGFYTRKELLQKARNASTPDWVMPILILAVYSCGIFAEEQCIE